MLDDAASYAANFITEHEIPSVSLAIWKDGTFRQGTAGILNLDTGVEATCDSIFQIGSITKVMTAALVMQLVDEGRVDLDASVRTYLTDFAIADRQASNTITVKQLLNHTSGIDGDFFPDDQDDEGNLIARFVDRCNQLPLIHRPGEHFSYSNAAYSIAGRLVEVMRAEPWARLMRERVFVPLGLNHSIAAPSDAIRFRIAIGHTKDEATNFWRTSKHPYLSMGQAPCGSTTTMSAADLVAFGRVFLEGGVAQSGVEWLSPKAVSAMTAPNIALPEDGHTYCKSWGIGWSISDLGSGIQIICHDGVTFGQMSTLQIMPDHNTVFSILLNATAPNVFEILINDVRTAILGQSPVLIESESDKESSPREFEELAGKYASLGTEINIQYKEEGLEAHISNKLGPQPRFTLKMKHSHDDTFATFDENKARQRNITFMRGKNDAVTHLNFGIRLVPRLCNA